MDGELSLKIQLGENTDRVTEPASAAAPAGAPLAIVVPSDSRYQAYF